jgi:hypothetical protein
MQWLRLTGGVLVASCSDAYAPAEPSVIRIVTTEAQYAPGAQVTVRFTNVSTEVLYHNSCHGALDRKTGAFWVVAGPAAGSGVACPDNLKRLQAGASDTTVLPLSGTLLPGLYRYRFSGIYGPDRGRLPEWERMSSPFSLVP